jgi:hypothetical protein
MLFRLQNAANSLTSPTMTVPFDTDVLLFLVSATSPSGHTQPMEVHAYVSVEQWPLWNPVRWATVPPVLPRKGRPTAWPGLPPGATKVRPRSRPRKKIFWSCAWFWQSGRFQFYYYWAFHSAHGPVRPHAACCCATCTGLLFSR